MLKLGQLRAAWGIEEVNLLVPVVIACGGIVVAATGRLMGIGIPLGALLALLNSMALVKRVALAVDSPNAAIATVSMQVGLMITFAVLGGVTLITLLVSVPMAAAMAITFFVVQTIEIALYYRARTAQGRSGRLSLQQKEAL